MLIILIVSSFLSLALFMSIIVLIRRHYSPERKAVPERRKSHKPVRKTLKKSNDFLPNGIVSRGILN